MATQKALADHLDLTATRIKQLEAQGVFERQGRSYNLDACRVAYLRWLRSRVPGGGASKDLNAERARLTAAQAEKTEIDLAERRGELLPVDSVASLWTRVLTDTKTKLLSLPSKLAPQVIGKSREEARAKIEHAIHEALRTLADTAGGDPDGTDAAAEGDGKRVGRRASKTEPGGERGARPLGH